MAKHNILLAIIPFVILLASIDQSSSSWSSDIDPYIGDREVQQHIFSRVGNKVPSPLRVQCKSGDRDLGMQTVRKNHQYYFVFRINFWGTSLYFCHFYWGQKQAVFDVWNNTLSRGSYCARPSPDYSCYWDVRHDGFYLSEDPSQATPVFVKFHDWN